MKAAKLTSSTRIRDAIKSFEALSLTAYLCPANKCTIGWGHTRTAKPGQVITIGEAQRLFDLDVQEVDNHIHHNVKVQLTQNQHDAIASLLFNIGIRNFLNSTLLKNLNEGKFESAQSQILAWNKITVNGKKVVSKGLVARRKKEAELFGRVS